MKALIKRIKRLCAWVREVYAEGKNYLYPRSSLRLASLKASLNNCYSQLSAERGAIGFSTIKGVFIAVILLVVLIQFLWQQGLPSIIEATSNTTALEAAGATSTQISWVTWVGGIIFILLIVAALVLAASSLGIGGGGGGGRHRRRR